MRRLLCAIALVFLCRSQGHAAALVAMQLVLAVDVSGSVSQDRFDLQRAGYAAAFRHPAVLQAIRSTSTGSIAVAMFQWTGPTLQVLTVDWTLIGDDASAERFAASVQRGPRVLFGGGTSISGAIDYARDVLARSPFQAERLVIDVSGDGANNRGRPAEDARDDAVQAGLVINGLPILAVEPDLDAYYLRNVIGGPGSFVIPVQRYEEFAAALRNKLIIEIADAASGEHVVDVVLRQIRVDQPSRLISPVLRHHAGQHGLDLLQMLDRSADALTGEVLERAGLKDRIDLLGHRRQ